MNIFIRTATGKPPGKGFDVVEIESLIQERKLARTAKNWQRADEIRQILAGKKIILKDTPTGTAWRVDRVYNCKLFKDNFQSIDRIRFGDRSTESIHSEFRHDRMIGVSSRNNGFDVRFHPD